MVECQATLLWVHKALQPQDGTFAHPAPGMTMKKFVTLSEAVREAVTQKGSMGQDLAWIHAWGAGGRAIFDEVEIEAIRRTIKAYDPSFP